MRRSWRGCVHTANYLLESLRVVVIYVLHLFHARVDVLLCFEVGADIPSSS
jgi:hypothetical protein